MIKAMVDHYRNRLRELSLRVEKTAASLEEDARSGTGDAGLSSAPMHLGDQGTELYLKQLDATLLENELHIQGEISGAMARMDAGTYGICESCGREIPEGRLDALPYARECVACSAVSGSGLKVNYNEGRSDNAGWVGLHPMAADRHATGTAGGGTAVGGLAGTNLAGGDPDEADLEAASSSGDFDRTSEDDDEGEGGRSGQ